MFCPKCGSLILPSKQDGKIILRCSCGFEQESKDNASFHDRKKQDFSSEEVVVHTGENPMATEDHICLKCGCGKAILIGSQIAVRETWCNCETDRPAYVCGKCGYKDFI